MLEDMLLVGVAPWDRPPLVLDKAGQGCVCAFRCGVNL